MDLFTVLQIIIALTFIYFIVSLVVSELQEQLASTAQWRARNLKQAIKIFVGNNICEKLYSSDTIFSSFNQSTNPNFGGGSEGPSYIEPQIFAESLLALINSDLDLPDKLAPDQELFPKSINSNTPAMSDPSEALSVVDKVGKIEAPTTNDSTNGQFSYQDPWRGKTSGFIRGDAPCALTSLLMGSENEALFIFPVLA